MLVAECSLCAPVPAFDRRVDTWNHTFKCWRGYCTIWHIYTAVWCADIDVAALAGDGSVGAQESVSRKLLPMPSGTDYEATRRLGASSQAQGPEAVMG